MACSSQLLLRSHLRASVIRPAAKCRRGRTKWIRSFLIGDAPAYSLLLSIYSPYAQGRARSPMGSVNGGCAGISSTLYGALSVSARRPLSTRSRIKAINGRNGAVKQSSSPSPPRFFDLRLMTTRISRRDDDPIRTPPPGS